MFIYKITYFFVLQIYIFFFISINKCNFVLKLFELGLCIGLSDRCIISDYEFK